MFNFFKCLFFVFDFDYMWFKVELVYYFEIGIVVFVGVGVGWCLYFKEIRWFVGLVEVFDCL